MAGSSFLATNLTLDKRGLVTAVTDPRGKATSFGYDAAGRRVSVEDALGNEVATTYDANGNATQIDEVESTGYGSATTFTTEMDYDAMDRREETRVLDETDANHEHVTTYEHDSLHVMVRRVDAEGNVTTFAHDGLGRVLEESIDLGSGALKKSDLPP